MKTLILLISLFCAPQFNSIQEMKVVKPNIIEETISEEKSFANFLSHFEKVEIPENFTHLKIQDYKTKYLSKKSTLRMKGTGSKKYLKLYVPELIYGNMSRLGPPIVEPLNRFYMDENTIAVTYLVKTRYNNTGFGVNLCVFDLKGKNKMSDMDKHLSQHSINLASVNVHNTILCEFKAPNVIEKTTYKNEWQKDIDEVGISGNTIVCYNRTGVEKVSITPNGIIEVSQIKPSFASLN